MPTRILREGILDSGRVNRLSWPAEVFYRRLMSVVDDFGRFDARPEVLRSRLYPLKVDTVRTQQVAEWLSECEAAGLVSCYSVDAKPFLLFRDLGPPRAKASRYPDPPASVNGCAQTLASVPYSDSDSDSDSLPPNPPKGGVGERFKKFWSEYPKKKDRDAAWRTFRDIDPDDKLTAWMIAAVKAKKASPDWQREGGRFVTQAAKWLADGSWEEYQPVKANRTNAGPEPEQKATAEEIKKVTREFLATG